MKSMWKKIRDAEFWRLIGKTSYWGKTSWNVECDECHTIYIKLEMLGSHYNC